MCNVSQAQLLSISLLAQLKHSCKISPAISLRSNSLEKFDPIYKYHLNQQLPTECVNFKEKVFCKFDDDAFN